VQALANQRSYLNLQRLLASRPSCGQSINMHLRARIKHSRIYTRNKWTLNLQASPLGDYQHCTRPPHWKSTSIERVPYAMSASAYLAVCITNQRSKRQQRRPTTMCPPRNGRFKPASPVVSHTDARSFSKEDLRPSGVSPAQRALQAYLTGSIAHRHSKLPQRRPTSIQHIPHATGAFCKGDLWPSSVFPKQWARFKSTSAVRRKRSFSGPTAAGVCPCNDSREQWC
jgi:hypothetical protein